VLTRAVELRIYRTANDGSFDPNGEFPKFGGGVPVGASVFK
jgi:hypothetical protein